MRLVSAETSSLHRVRRLPDDFFTGSPSELLSLEVVLTCSLGQILPAEKFVIDPGVFWRHSLGCALVCKKFCEISGALSSGLGVDGTTNFDVYGSALQTVQVNTTGNTGNTQNVNYGHFTVTPDWQGRIQFFMNAQNSGGAGCLSWITIHEN